MDLAQSPRQLPLRKTVAGRFCGACMMKTDTTKLAFGSLRTEKKLKIRETQVAALCRCQ